MRIRRDILVGIGVVVVSVDVTANRTGVAVRSGVTCDSWNTSSVVSAKLSVNS